MCDQCSPDQSARLHSLINIYAVHSKSLKSRYNVNVERRPWSDCVDECGNMGLGLLCVISSVLTWEEFNVFIKSPWWSCFIQLRNSSTSILTFTTLRTDSVDKNWSYLSYFSQKTGFDISCKLSPKETTCTKRQSLLSEKNKKLFQTVVRWIFTQHA